jgi:hypothetical protein
MTYDEVLSTGYGITDKKPHRLLESRFNDSRWAWRCLIIYGRIIVPLSADCIFGTLNRQSASIVNHRDK